MWDSFANISSLEGLAAAASPILGGSAIRATILLAVVGIAAWSTHAMSAALRHLLWLSAFVGLAALPFLALILPGWNVLPNSENVPRELNNPDIVRTLKHSGDSRVGQMPTPPRRMDEEGAAPGIAVVPVAHEQVQATIQISWRLVLLIAWVGGVAIALIPILAGTVSLHRLEKRSELVHHERIESATLRAAGRLGVRRPVRVMWNSQRSMPMLWGILNPKVLLPAVARTWSVDRTEAVLTHEMGHVRRLDCLTQLLVRFVCAAYWFHPLVWWAASRMRVEAETACDDLVLLSGCRPCDYAEHLLDVAAGSQGRSLFGAAAIGMARRSQLEIRLRAILDRGRNRTPATAASTACCLSLAAGIAFPLALLRSEPPGDGAPRVPVAIENPFIEPGAETPVELGPLPIRLGYVDDTAEGARSIAGSGHAVEFRRPEDARYLMAIEIFAHRYGDPTPPAEDFHVYILDKNRNLIQACPYPYSQIEWGSPRWHTLKLPAIDVPEEYIVALAFNPQQTKGIFLGLDENVRVTHSYTGRPTTGFQLVDEAFDWMIRSVLVREIPKDNPFDSDGD